jgi:hypothetical protein
MTTFTPSGKGSRQNWQGNDRSYDAHYLVTSPTVA